MKPALLAAVAVILFRLVLFYTGHAPEGTDFMPVHMLMLVIIPFFTGHALLRAEPEAGFPPLLREGFKAIAMYALLYGVFIWMYYKGIHVTEFPIKINERVEQAMAQGVPEAEARTRIEGFFTPFNYASITFFALLIIGGMNSVVVALLHHKVLGRFTR